MGGVNCYVTWPNTVSRHKSILRGMSSLTKERKARAQLEQSLLSPKASAVAAQYKGKVWSFQPGMGRLVDEMVQDLSRNPVKHTPCCFFPHSHP